MKFLTWLNIVALFEPKGKRNRENKLNLNEGTILFLLDKLQKERHVLPNVRAFIHRPHPPPGKPIREYGEPQPT